MQSLREGMRRSGRRTSHEPAAQNAALLLGMLDVWYTQYFEYDIEGGRPLRPRPRTASQPPAAAADGEQRQVGDRRGRPRFLADVTRVWGAPGTNGQHAFFQLLHQGTARRPGRLHRRPSIAGDERAQLLQANLLAQAAASAARADRVGHSMRSGVWIRRSCRTR